MLLGVLTLAFIVGLLTLLFSKARKIDNKRATSKKNIENEFYEKLKENNIIATQKLYIPYHKDLIEMLVIDDVNKRLVYLSRPKKGADTSIKLQSFKYSDVIGCELINVTNTETTEDMASLRNRRRTHTIVYRQGFRIILNDLSNPTIEMLFIEESLGTRVSCISAIEEWIAKIKIVINQGKQEKVS